MVLSPCPFCGGRAEYLGGIKVTGYVMCRRCEVMGPNLIESEAVEAWNKRASIPPEAPRRRLLDTDPHCPSCGHNRDTSSVSSIDASQVHGEWCHYCQKCGAAWTEIETTPSPLRQKP